MKLLDRIQPADIIAMIVVIGGLALKFTGADGLVGTLLTAVVVFYFGDRTVISPLIEKREAKKETGSVEEIIREIAKDEGIDADLAVKVAKCESSLNPMAVHINKSGSKDRGVFQWNDKWHPEITNDMAFDVEIATRAFCKAFKNGHLDWWNASKKCWGKG